MLTAVDAEPGRVRRPRLTRVAVAVVSSVVLVVAAAAFLVFSNRVRTGAGPLGSNRQNRLTSCSPARPDEFIAAESLWLHNDTRSPAVIRSITLDHPENVTVLGFFLDDIEPTGSGETSPGSAWAPIRSGVAALHARSAIGYSVPARTVSPRHALRVAVEPIDGGQPWSYSGLELDYRAGGHRYRLDVHTALVIPAAHHRCSDALMDAVG